MPVELVTATTVAGGKIKMVAVELQRAAFGGAQQCAAGKLQWCGARGRGSGFQLQHRSWVRGTNTDVAGVVINVIARGRPLAQTAARHPAQRAAGIRLQNLVGIRQRRGQGIDAAARGRGRPESHIARGRTVKTERTICSRGPQIQ